MASQMRLRLPFLGWFERFETVIGQRFSVRHHGLLVNCGSSNQIPLGYTRGKRTGRGLPVFSPVSFSIRFDPIIKGFYVLKLPGGSIRFHVVSK